MHIAGEYYPLNDYRVARYLEGLRVGTLDSAYSSYKMGFHASVFYYLSDKKLIPNVRREQKAFNRDRGDFRLCVRDFNYWKQLR